MNVIIASVEDDNFICVARDTQRAIDFLCDNYWITDSDQFYIDKAWKSIKDILGNDWKDVLKNMDLNELRHFFNGNFYFSATKIY